MLGRAASSSGSRDRDLASQWCRPSATTMDSCPLTTLAAAFSIPSTGCAMPQQATGRFVAGIADPPDLAQYDRVSAEALTDSLAHFAEPPDWSTATLLDLARNPTLMNDGHFDRFCTCGATQ